MLGPGLKCSEEAGPILLLISMLSYVFYAFIESFVSYTLRLFIFCFVTNSDMTDNSAQNPKGTTARRICRFPGCTNGTCGYVTLLM